MIFTSTACFGRVSAVEPIERLLLLAKLVCFYVNGVRILGFLPFRTILAKFSIILT